MFENLNDIPEEFREDWQLSVKRLGAAITAIHQADKEYQDAYSERNALVIKIWRNKNGEL